MIEWGIQSIFAELINTSVQLAKWVTEGMTITFIHLIEHRSLKW